MAYTMKKTIEKTDFSAHTLRYYEKEGLLPGIGRTKGGIRYYTDEDMATLSMIYCLKHMDMPLTEIAHFVHLTQEGDHILPERIAILKKQEQHVLERMEQMKQHLERVKLNVDFYSEKLKVFEESNAEP